MGTVERAALHCIYRLGAVICYVPVSKLHVKRHPTFLTCQSECKSATLQFSLK